MDFYSAKIELWRQDFEEIDEKYLERVTHLLKLYLKSGYVFQTYDNRTFVYGEACDWLSLKHDPKRPQEILELRNKKIRQVDQGFQFIAFLTEDEGDVYICSKSSDWDTGKQLVKITKEMENFIKISCGGQFIILLRHDGYIFSFGYGQYGELGSEKQIRQSFSKLIYIPLENVQDICCGTFHCLALTTNYSLFAWGWNYYGQLGLNDCEDRHKPRIIDFFETHQAKIKKISAIRNGSMALLDDGHILMWGTRNRQQYNHFPDFHWMTRVHDIASNALEDYVCAYCWTTRDQIEGFFVIWTRDYNPTIVTWSGVKSFCEVHARIVLNTTPSTYGWTKNKSYLGPENFRYKDE